MVYSKSLNWSSWMRSSLSFTTVRMLTAAFFKRSTATCFEAWTLYTMRWTHMFIMFVIYMDHTFCIFSIRFRLCFLHRLLAKRASVQWPSVTDGLCSQAKILILLVDRWPSPSSNNTWRRCWVDRGRESTRMLHGVAKWPGCFLTCQVLSDYDPDMAAQEMIVEQFIAPWSKWCEMMWNDMNVRVWCIVEWSLMIMWIHIRHVLKSKSIGLKQGMNPYKWLALFLLFFYQGRSTAG